jgi:hypothetical protein
MIIAIYLLWLGGLASYDSNKNSDRNEEQDNEDTIANPSDLEKRGNHYTV